MAYCYSAKAAKSAPRTDRAASPRVINALACPPPDGRLLERARTYLERRPDDIGSIWAGSWGALSACLQSIAFLPGISLSQRPWYEPLYARPIVGMILGNTLTGVSLGLKRMTGELATHH
ncbi:ABC transporter permease [Mycetohabitans sp. B8]|uniref:ABC transporter permease n=1 Tax=Mycetohabitans sp. B8 TaxID=2841845 RepID=UPI001F45EF8E|nr:ABC transporter permease [Mycetohabitans sp. B8]MCG1042227.1 ABC transporter permease [Mycetohabitans sp. B8]